MGEKGEKEEKEEREKRSVAGDLETDWLVLVLFLSFSFLFYLDFLPAKPLLDCVDLDKMIIILVSSYCISQLLLYYDFIIKYIQDSWERNGLGRLHDNDNFGIHEFRG